MDLTPAQFEKAFAEFQQFGPRRRIPIEERWREILPELQDREVAALKAECKAIEAFALALAGQVRTKQLDDAAAKAQLARNYPILQQARLDHTWSQALYYALK